MFKNDFKNFVIKALLLINMNKRILICIMTFKNVLFLRTISILLLNLKFNIQYFANYKKARKMLLMWREFHWLGGATIIHLKKGYSNFHDIKIIKLMIVLGINIIYLYSFFLNIFSIIFIHNDILFNYYLIIIWIYLIIMVKNCNLFIFYLIIVKKKN